MNIPTQKDSSDLRQRDLQRQIFEALNVDDRERFVFLQSQWVHRYGLETLPDEKQLRNIFQDEASTSFSSEANGSDSQNSLIGNNHQITEEENSYLEQVNDSGEILILSERKSEEKSEDNANPIDNEEIKSQIENSLNQKELNEADQGGNNESVKKDALNKKENAESKTNSSVEEFIRIPSPPPPSLNKLRRWLN